MEINKHELYETPEIEVIEIDLEHSIAVSGKKGVGFFEEIWG
jgi:hypothetical protein